MSHSSKSGHFELQMLTSVYFFCFPMDFFYVSYIYLVPSQNHNLPYISTLQYILRYMRFLIALNQGTKSQGNEVLQVKM